MMGPSSRASGQASVPVFALQGSGELQGASGDGFAGGVDGGVDDECGKHALGPAGIYVR
jgi:hypothetical protein